MPTIRPSSARRQLVDAADRFIATAVNMVKLLLLAEGKPISEKAKDEPLAMAMLTEQEDNEAALDTAAEAAGIDAGSFVIIRPGEVITRSTCDACGHHVTTVCHPGAVIDLSAIPKARD